MCFMSAKKTTMKKSSTLTLRSIFRYLMENRHYPVYEKTHIIFGLDGNMAVIELNEDIVTLRVFFSIEKSDYYNLMEASNSCMLQTYMVKPVLLDDRQNIMFSCECLCVTFRDFTRFFPRMTMMIKESLTIHKAEMKNILLADEILKATLPVTEETATGSARKILS